MNNGPHSGTRESQVRQQVGEKLGRFKTKGCRKDPAIWRLQNGVKRFKTLVKKVEEKNCELESSARQTFSFSLEGSLSVFCTSVAVCSESRSDRHLADDKMSIREKDLFQSKSQHPRHIYSSHNAVPWQFNSFGWILNSNRQYKYLVAEELPKREAHNSVMSGQQPIEAPRQAKDYIRTLFNFLICRKSPFGMKRFSIGLVLVEARLSRWDSDNLHKAKVNSVPRFRRRFRNQRYFQKACSGKSSKFSCSASQLVQDAFSPLCIFVQKVGGLNTSRKGGFVLFVGDLWI